MDKFYFAYGYNEKYHKANRLYRRVNFEFERYIKESGAWIPAPEQSCIYIGEDWEYEEITEEEANRIIEDM